MLRSPDAPKSRKILAVILVALVGAAAAWLVALGNPGNMGICGACFLRDLAGALGLLSGKGPACFRPELAGLVLGAFLWKLTGGSFQARSGSHAASRFVLGIWMGIGALAFLGCPFRMLQRLGGGDLAAWCALPGFVAGVFIALQFERKGYTVGATSPAPAPVGLLAPLAAIALLLLYLKGGRLLGPGPADAALKPAHAPWHVALGIALAAGAALSATGFCAISAARQIFQPGKKAMLLAALVFVAGYAAISAGTGKFTLSMSGQPIAHADLLWNVLALALLGMTGALAGGCPVRQVVMTGEGNGDAFVTASGILAGGALAHTLGLAAVAASPDAAGGVPFAGKLAVACGIAFSLAYGLAVARINKTSQPARTF